MFSYIAPGCQAITLQLKLGVFKVKFRLLGPVQTPHDTRPARRSSWLQGHAQLRDMVRLATFIRDADESHEKGTISFPVTCCSSQEYEDTMNWLPGKNTDRKRAKKSFFQTK